MVEVTCQPIMDVTTCVTRCRWSFFHKNRSSTYGAEEALSPGRHTWLEHIRCHCRARDPSAIKQSGDDKQEWPRGTSLLKHHRPVHGP